MATTIRLAEGMNWVELQPLAGGVAKVVAGNVHMPGDLVASPGGLSWEEAAALGGAPSDTALSPFDLELRYDSVTDVCLTPAGDEGDIQDLAAHPSASDSKSPAAKLVAASGEDEAMRRTLGAVQVTSVEFEVTDETPAEPAEPPAKRSNDKRDAA
jgi:hypothetical protein